MAIRFLTNAAKQELCFKSNYCSTKNLQLKHKWQILSYQNTSKNKRKSVELLGLLNSDPELLNGLVLGIEGEAREKSRWFEMIKSNC